MKDFRNIEELPRKKSIFPDWFPSVMQKWLPLAGLLSMLAGFIVAASSGSMTAFGLIIGGMVAIILSFFCSALSLGIRGRETKEWVNEDGSYDAVSPRAYSKLNDALYHRFAYQRNKNALELFAIDNKEIYVLTKDGSEFQAPIADTDVNFFIMPGNTTANTVVKFKLSSGSQQIQFNVVNGMLEEEEYEDIYNLLARANSFAPTKNAGKLNLITKILSLIAGEDSVDTSSVAKAKDWELKGHRVKIK